jgi:hypothetical protein
MVHRRLKRPAKRKNRADGAPRLDLPLPRAERIALKKRASGLEAAMIALQALPGFSDARCRIFAETESFVENLHRTPFGAREK